MGQRQDEMIAIDSQTSICMIAKYMDSLQTLRRCKHKVMLEDNKAQLLARARKGLQTRVLKVKFHIGTQGNEEADRLAAAATAATDSSKCSQEYAIGPLGPARPLLARTDCRKDEQRWQQCSRKVAGRGPQIIPQESRPYKMPNRQCKHYPACREPS